MTSGPVGDTDCAARFSAKPAIFHCLASFYFGSDAAIWVTRQAEPEKRVIFLYSLTLVAGKLRSAGTVNSNRGLTASPFDISALHESTA